MRSRDSEASAENLNSLAFSCLAIELSFKSRLLCSAWCPPATESPNSCVRRTNSSGALPAQCLRNADPSRTANVRADSDATTDRNHRPNNQLNPTNPPRPYLDRSLLNHPLLSTPISPAIRPRFPVTNPPSDAHESAVKNS
jgi:hypothetical protein